MSPADAIRAVCDGWNRLDNDAIADVFAEDGVFEDPLHERHLHGREEIRATNAPAVDALSECRVTLGHVLEEGEVGFAEGRFEAVVAEDGTRMDFPFAMLVEMRGGAIGRLAEYFDTRPLAP